MDCNISEPRPLYKEFSLNQGAATYDLFTAAGDVLFMGLVVRCSAAAAAPLTSVSIVTDDTTAETLMTTVEGAVANLLAQAQLNMAWTARNQPALLRNGKKVRVTIAGGASATGVLECVALWRPVSGNGFLT